MGKINTSYTNQKEKETHSLIIHNHQFHKSLDNISGIADIIN